MGIRLPCFANRQNSLKVGRSIFSQTKRAISLFTYGPFSLGYTDSNHRPRVGRCARFKRRQPRTNSFSSNRIFTKFILPHLSRWVKLPLPLPEIDHDVQAGVRDDLWFGWLGKYVDPKQLWRTHVKGRCGQIRPVREVLTLFDNRATLS